MEARAERATAIRIDRQAVRAVSVVPAAFPHIEAGVRLNELHPSAPVSFHSPPTTFVLRV
jgi:hypothetical protein